MESQITIAALAVGILLVVGASLGDAARRRSPLAWHAHVPWHALTFVGMAVALFAIIHLVSIARAGG